MKTLGILRIEVSSSQAHMNHEYFKALIMSSEFEKFPKEMHELLSSIVLMPQKPRSLEKQ